jgi:hypothetical protein
MTEWGGKYSGVGRGILRGLWVRIWGTVALLTGGLLFVILYLGFLATRFPWYENLAVVLSTIILVPVLAIAIWASWALGFARKACRLDTI